jgi:deleted-in-malignant-brain-tumors protein 1
MVHHNNFETWAGLSYTMILTGAIAASGRYIERTLPVHIMNLNCTGEEQTVLECPHNNLADVPVCGSNQDASIRCQGW